MAGYIGNKSSVVSSGAERKFKFAITETTTTLSNLAYTRDLVHVFHNGVRLVDGTDYTATNGTSITLTNAAENGDEVVVVSYASFQPSDTVSASLGGIFEGNVTVNADLTVSGNTDINGGTIDGTVIGGTTPAAISGTTGTFSGNLTVDTDTLFVDAANNRVGIGTSSPNVNFQVTGITSLGGTGQSLAVYENGAGVSVEAFDTSNSATKKNMWFNAYGGNVGIGTNSPAADFKLDVNGAFTVGGTYNTATSTNGGGVNIGFDVTNGGKIESLNPAVAWFPLKVGGSDLKFETGGSERMRIDSSGNVGIGVSPSTAYLEMAPNAAWGAGIRFGGNGNVSDTTYANICTTNGNIHIDPRVGSYGTYLNWYSGTGGVHVGNAGAGYGQILAATFTTISDYRMKEDVQPMVGVVDRLMALNPVNFAWKADGTRVDGFIAHETQEVVPEAVVGEKDDVNADGDPVYQGIDHGKLVPLLTAALQEALTKINDQQSALELLEARVAQLEGGAA